ncbi:hypothetical protein JCM10908_003325 [Rhodotorula pacifica]|uniref:polyamine acetyltransferase n=1 Tax=Rhodotorula pacifica TaxID=1495444 RepID=UPI003177B733
MATQIVYDLVQASDIDRAFEIETQGFPEDEAASLESLRYRQEHAGDYFLGAYEATSDGSTSTSDKKDRLLVGYICATLTSHTTLTHDTMSTHEPSGGYIAIHSVCVAPSHRGKGIASSLLKEYIARFESTGGKKGALLIAHPELVPLYEKAGFTVVGSSAVVHGAKPWIELRRDFPLSSSSSSGEAAPSSSAPVAQQQEQQEEGEVRSPGRLLSYFRAGMDDLVDRSNNNNTNKVNLYCPRADCRCLLLRAGAGTWVQGTKHDIQLPELPRPLSAPAPPEQSASSSRGYWSVSSPLAFENIGFSRNAAPPSSSSSSSSSSSPSASTIKYLTCADCDHGPLGWHDTEGRDLGMEVQAENEAREGASTKGQPEVRKGREFLLAVDRVRYKVEV